MDRTSPRRDYADRTHMTLRIGGMVSMNQTMANFKLAERWNSLGAF